MLTVCSGSAPFSLVVGAQREDQQQTVRPYGLPAQTRVALRAHRNEVVVRVHQGVGHASAYPSRNEADLAKGDGEGRNPVIWDGALVFDRILALMEVPLSTAEKRGLVRRRLLTGRLQTKEPRT